MKLGWIDPVQMVTTSDWRPIFHLSPAMYLERLGAHWPRLGDLAECLDGWRVSSNPTSVAYDERVGTVPIFRMRHVGDTQLLTEAEHWKVPVVVAEVFCVRPNDVLVRKVGRVGAALVSELHRRHPVDANLAIVRGLEPALALWVAFCLNRPLYRAFLERLVGMTNLPRVGLKQLASTPVVPPPEGFGEFARRYAQNLIDFDQSQDRLSRLRGEVASWVNERFADYQEFMLFALDARRWRRFEPEDLAEVLLISVMEQRFLARRLRQDGEAVSLTKLASVNPRHPAVAHESGCKVLRIGDLDNHLGIATRLADREEVAWRVQHRPVERFDVLVSTFAAESRVAFAAAGTGECVLPTEQLVTLCFHHHQGAYALLMESVLMQAQWQRLATGSMQRFVPPSSVSQLVMPTLDPSLAEDWHERLVAILAARSKAQANLQTAKEKMFDYYRSVHPAFENDGLEAGQGGEW